MNHHQKYGLASEDIEGIVSILKDNRKVSKAILFGSRAKGNYSAGSDVDIALQGDNLKLNDIIDISMEIDDLYLPNKVDLIIFDRINESALIGHINRVGITLFEKKPSDPHSV